MKLTFDFDKDQLNRVKHGVSLARASDMDIAAILPDDRFEYGEARFRAFGYIDGHSHCLAFTVRNDAVRAISLRRAHSKEMKRYVR